MAAGQLALGHELVGTGARDARACAASHALERMQFGRPIASFQAVRHRLAESLVAIEAAAALLAAAWDEPDPVSPPWPRPWPGGPPAPWRATANRCSPGIGFTTEHTFHRYFRRIVVLDQLLGAGSELTRQLGGDVLASGSLPAILPALSRRPAARAPGGEAVRQVDYASISF